MIKCTVCGAELEDYTLLEHIDNTGHTLKEIVDSIK